MGMIAEKGGCGVCIGGGEGGSVSSRPPEGSEHRWDAGTKELAGVCLLLSFFPLGSSEPSYTHPNTHFPPPSSILTAPTHIVVFSIPTFFFSSFNTALSFLFSLGS